MRFMKFRNLIIGAVAVVAGAGCGVNSGFLRDSGTLNSFQYRMDVSSISYVRQAAGSSAIGSVFCAIPVGRDLYKNAMQELYANAQLKPNETLVNFREDSSTTVYLGFYCTTELTLSADVVALTPTGGAGPAPMGGTGLVPIAPPPPPVAP